MAILCVGRLAALDERAFCWSSSIGAQQHAVGMLRLCSGDGLQLDAGDEMETCIPVVFPGGLLDDVALGGLGQFRIQKPSGTSDLWTVCDAVPCAVPMFLSVRSARRLAQRSRTSLTLPWKPSQLQYCVDEWCPELVGQRAVKELLLLLCMSVRCRCYALEPLRPLRILLVGPQGSGKSTLVHALAELLDPFVVKTIGGSHLVAKRRQRQHASAVALSDLAPTWISCPVGDSRSGRCLASGVLLSTEVLCVDDLESQCATSGGSDAIAMLLNCIQRVPCPAGTSTVATVSHHVIAVTRASSRDAAAVSLPPTVLEKFSLVCQMHAPSDGAEHALLSRKTLREASGVSCQRLGSINSLHGTSHAASRCGSTTQSSQLGEPPSYDWLQGERTHGGEGCSSGTLCDLLATLAAQAPIKEEQSLDGVARYCLTALLRLEESSLAQLLSQSTVPSLVELLCSLSLARRVFDRELPLVPHCVDDVLRCLQSSTATRSQSDRLCPSAKRPRSSTAKGTARLTKKEGTRKLLEAMRRTAPSYGGEVPVGVCRSLFDTCFAGAGDGVAFDDVLNTLSREGLVLHGRTGLRPL